MESTLLRHIPHLLVLLSFACVPAMAQERPWGRLDKSLKSPDSTNSQPGYLGRYNPWGNAQGMGGGEEAEQPRYRELKPRSENRYRPAPYAYPRGYPERPEQAYPSPDSYGMPYGGGYPGGAMGMAPWFGGINPNYGNYWNDPYESLSPDTGLLWSDMWRW